MLGTTKYAFSLDLNCDLSQGQLVYGDRRLYDPLATRMFILTFLHVYPQLVNLDFISSIYYTDASLKCKCIIKMHRLSIGKLSFTYNNVAPLKNKNIAIS